MYMSQSLAFEIIYTTLNGISQQIQLKSGKTVNKSQNKIKKIKSLVKDARYSATAANLNLDFYSENVYEMKENIIENLNLVKDY